MATDVLVFVPGVLGSELWDAGGRLWPGSIWDAIAGFDDAKFARLLAPGLEARDIVRSAAGGLVAVYEPWVDAFEAIRRGGLQPFAENPAGGKTKTLYVFPYDWRLDITATAQMFADHLDGILGSVADADVKLVCHSMGGLVARYYLESGAFDQRPAFSRVSLLVTFGTPHNGATVAYAGAVGLHKTSFLSMDQTRQMANDPRYPSLYQMFPAPSHSFLWHDDPAQAWKTFPVDDPAIVARYGLGASSLQAWRTFRAGLTGAKGTVRYFYIVGSRQETLTRLHWDGNDLRRFELDDAGDGTVPLPGALDLAVQCEFVGKSHASLIETRPARETLAGLFGGTTVLAAAHVGATLAVRDLVVSVVDAVHVQIEFVPEVSRFAGHLSFERADLPAAGTALTGTEQFVGVGFLPAIPVELNSDGISYLNLKTKPMQFAGVYRPVLTGEGMPPIVGPSFVAQREQPL